MGLIAFFKSSVGIEETHFVCWDLPGSPAKRPVRQPDGGSAEAAAFSAGLWKRNKCLEHFWTSPQRFARSLEAQLSSRQGFLPGDPGPVVPLRFDPPAGIFLPLLLAEILRAVMQSGARLPSPSPAYFKACLSDNSPVLLPPLLLLQPGSGPCRPQCCSEPLCGSAPIPR